MKLSTLRCLRSLAHFANLATRRCLCSNAGLLRYELLGNRSLLGVDGPDAKSFLQGLVTNDLGCLDKCQRGAVFTMLLNAQGRVLFDAIVYVHQRPDSEGARAYLLEADSAQLPDLAKHLRRYRLRRRVEIGDASDRMRVAVLLPRPGGESDEERERLLRDLAVRSGAVCLVRDPRLPVGWAHRWLLDGGSAAAEGARLFQGLEAAPDGAYMMERYRLGIGEGPSDHPAGRALPLECNAALLNGVSFNKGCYLGQELTARTHHTGVVRKRLAPIAFAETSAPPADAEDGLAGAALLDARTKDTVGQVRSVRGGRGLALLRVGRMRPGPPGQQLLCAVPGGGGRVFEATAWRPDWWPAEVVTGPAQGGPADGDGPD